MADEQEQRSYLRLPNIGGLPNVGQLAVGGFVADRLNDALGLLSSLPEMGATLRSINAHVISLDTEVIRMRHGVDHLEREVIGLRAEMSRLSDRLGAVNEHVATMDGRLETMEPSIESVGRVAGRLRRNRRGDTA